MSTLSSQNERLVRTLKDARQQIVNLKSEVDRLAQPPNAYGLIVETHDDDTVDILTSGRKMRVAVSPAIDPVDLGRGPGGHAQRGAQRRRRLRVREGRRGRHGQGDPRGRPDPRRRPRRRGAGLPPRRAAGRRAGAGRGLADARPAVRIRLRASPDGRGPGPGPGRGPGHRLRGHRWARRPDRGDPRRRRAALPAPGAVQGAPPQATQGRAALRAAGMRQDPHRQGGRGLPRPQGGRTHRDQGREELLPQHQGPRAAEQVRRRDRAAHPADLPARSGEGVRRHARRGLLRRDGLALPHAWLRRLQRRRDDDRAAAALRDRRRGAAGERHRHRRLQPRGHDRPGDPAPGAARRQDQDRATRRRGRPGHLQQVPHDPAAAERGRRARVRRRPRGRRSRR